ncbi:MAG: glycine--tRNA ligase [Candidatus Pacebacteria bacterium]|nr:glycine--tRNA ligase [Candidatus Paceibacterota bacterium]
MIMENTMEKIISLAKRRGFVFQGSEIYGGLSGTWDYGPLGVLLKNNIKNSWWDTFVKSRDDMYGLDAAILMNQEVWQASGHVGNFSDPMVECSKCKKRFRGDQLEESKCPDCGGELEESKDFNMMFETYVGPFKDEDSISYLRPETAQGIFVNFKNVVDSMQPRLPFGIGQIGKAFRNEIAPRDFVFRSREFEQMEVEYFVKETDWQKHFDMWKEVMNSWMSSVGIDMDKVHELDVSEEDRAHYSKKTIDFEFDFPFGRKELFGLAYRTDYDLSKHMKESGEKLEYIDPDTHEKIVPHVIEPSLGLDRAVLAVLVSAYSEDEVGEEKRVFLKLPKEIAPVKVAVFPLLKNKPELVEKARGIYEILKKEIPDTVFDSNGNIGKRYRRQDEIGTPHCITVDFDTLEDDTVTLRDRDTAGQDRVKVEDVLLKLKN